MEKWLLAKSKAKMVGNNLTCVDGRNILNAEGLLENLNILRANHKDFRGERERYTKRRKDLAYCGKN